MNITLRSLFGILTLSGLLCVPMSFPNGLKLYLVFGHGLLGTLLVISLFIWRSKSRSILKAFIYGTFCMLILSLIWPFGFLFYMAMTNKLGLVLGANKELKLAVALLITSGFGGLIGIILAIGFLQPKQKG